MKSKIVRILGAHARGNAVRGVAVLAAGFALGFAALSAMNSPTDRGPAHPKPVSGGELEDPTAVGGSPAHLLLVVRGLELTDLPAMPQGPTAVAASRAPTRVELLLDTWILGKRGERQTYQITSRLVAVERGETVWSRVYAGELLSRRAIRLQLSRAVGDAIIYTRMAERSQLMVRLNRSETAEFGRGRESRSGSARQEAGPIPIHHLSPI